MALEYMHIGIPVTEKRPNMIYAEGMKLWLNENPDEYDYKIEYLKFEEGGPFPEIMHQNPHVAFKTDDLTPYVEDADQVLYGPADNGPGVRLAFIMKDNVIIELYEDKN